MNGFGLPSLFSNDLAGRRWIYVERRFQRLQGNLNIATPVIEDARTKVEGVIKAVNRAFRQQSVVDYCLAAGSWGKETAINPPSDVDLIVVLPEHVFHRFDAYAEKKQSHLLALVKETLAQTYPQTTMRQDGQVVVVDFNSITVEVVPAFVAQGRGLIICDTNNGGRWKLVDPLEEMRLLEQSDRQFGGNHRKLTRILKQWRRHCGVSIKSFHLEKLVGEALSRMSWGGEGEFWFDWIVRDAFAHMISRAGGGFFMPGGFNEWIDLGDAWKAKAEIAYRQALQACAYEQENLDLAAGNEWQKIFGPTIPDRAI